MGTGALVGMAIADLFTHISDSIVSQNNERISNETAQLQQNPDPLLDSAMEIYNPFIQLIITFAKSAPEDDGPDEIDVETALNYIDSLNDILMELYNQANKYLDISPDDEEYQKYIQWLEFWSLMFFDSDEFDNKYRQISALTDMPEMWDVIAKSMDSILENDEGWDEQFSDILYSFGATIYDNLNSVLELMENPSFDEDFVESMNEIIASNNQAVYTLEYALDRATDYLLSLLSR